MKISYIGSSKGTSAHRAKALERLGCSVRVIDPNDWMKPHPALSAYCYKTGAFAASWFIERQIIQRVSEEKTDVFVVNQGEYLGPSLVRKLSSIAPTVNYINDDPFGGRDGLRFRRMLRSVREYDALVVVRQVNVQEALSLGAKNVRRVFMSSDELVHAPLRARNAPKKQGLESKVSFIGTWMPERGPFLAKLIDLGVPLSIWGGGWQKAPEWCRLKGHFRGPQLDSDEEYAAAVESAEICLGLLSVGNRDQHTTRSMEIPSLQGLLCAQRTEEHLDLYNEGQEALFWDSAEECASICMKLLQDKPRRDAIALAGYRRALRNGHFNEQVMQQVIELALSSRGKTDEVSDFTSSFER